MRLDLLVVMAALVLAGCVTAMPVNQGVDVDPGTAPSCERACNAVGMKVAAIVFIRNMGGCVCEPGASAGQDGASAAQMGGAVLVMLEEEEASRQQQLQQQRQQQQSSPPPGAGSMGSGHH